MESTPTMGAMGLGLLTMVGLSPCATTLEAVALKLEKALRTELRHRQT